MLIKGAAVDHRFIKGCVSIDPLKFLSLDDGVYCWIHYKCLTFFYLAWFSPNFLLMKNVCFFISNHIYNICSLCSSQCLKSPRSAPSNELDLCPSWLTHFLGRTSTKNSPKNFQGNLLFSHWVAHKIEQILHDISFDVKGSSLLFKNSYDSKWVS